MIQVRNQVLTSMKADPTPQFVNQAAGVTTLGEQYMMN